MSKDNKRDNDKGRAKVSFKAMMIAMVVALLGFLGFGGLELGNGDGADVDSGNKSGIISEVDQSEESNNEDSDDDLSGYVIYVKEDKILIPSDDMESGVEEVSLEYIKEALAALPSDERVMVFDDGAINKTYEEVIELVDESGLRKIEDVLTN